VNHTHFPKEYHVPDLSMSGQTKGDRVDKELLQYKTHEICRMD